MKKFTENGIYELECADNFIGQPKIELKFCDDYETRIIERVVLMLGNTVVVDLLCEESDNFGIPLEDINLIVRKATMNKRIGLVDVKETHVEYTEYENLGIYK